jgi:putative ABC transport system permease protein
MRMLERLLSDDCGSGSALLGDLRESYHVELSRRGPIGAVLWFWTETLVALWHYGKPRHVLGSLFREDRMESFALDLRQGVRMLWRAPGFTSLVIVTLALAIGATAAIYSVVAPVLIRPLPYPSPDRIVLLNERDANNAPENLGFRTIADIRSETRTLASIAVYGGWSATIGDHGEPEQLLGQKVSWNYFDVLGIRMGLGRGFTPEDDRPGNNNVVVLSYGLWQRRFGGDSAVIGRTIRLDDKPFRIAAVLPRTFENVIFPDAQIWRVLGYAVTQPAACRTCRHLNAVGRLRDGVSPAQAAAELNGISTRLARAFPDAYPTPGMFVDRLQHRVTESMRPALLAILSAAVLVLLIAAANVVNLQLARAIRRDSEFVIRIALGAGRSRLAQQLFAESLIVAGLAGVVGLILARVAVPYLVTRLPADLPRLSAIRVDGGAVAVIGAIVLSLAVIVGIAPVVVRRTRDVFTGALRGAGRLGDASTLRARRLIVISEVALALVLLSGAGLVARSIVRLLGVDTGFDPQHVLTLRLQSSGASYQADSSVFGYHDRVLAAVSRIPGVIQAGVANQLPLTGDLDTYGVSTPDGSLAKPALNPYADRYSVDGEFMRAMSIRVIAGRPFDRDDTGDSSRSVIVSLSLAERLWPGENAIGKHVTMGNATVRTVIGVAKDVRHHGLDTQTGLQFYLPERSWDSADNWAALVVRTDGNPAALADAVRTAVVAVDPSQPVARPESMQGIIRASTAQRQLALTLFAAFAALALVLAAAGIYGVLAGSVAERTREIGLRTALGATPRDVLLLVVRAGVAMALVGIAVGLGATALLTRYIHALLFGIPDTDALTLGAAAGLLLLTAVLACVLPALRAIRIDPMSAMRAE